MNWAQRAMGEQLTRRREQHLVRGALPRGLITRVEDGLARLAGIRDGVTERWGEVSIVLTSSSCQLRPRQALRAR